MYKQHYQYFLKQHEEELHCAPHSHHYWPDVTREAQLAYWDDSARGADHKWDIIFGERVPSVQRLLSDLTQHPAPEQWVFAGNTHELLYRVITCFDPAKPLRILTTDSEFHSFSRQVRRLQERATVHVDVVPTEPFKSFSERWVAQLQNAEYELIFCSQVFFNSGVIAPWVGDWIDHVPATTQVVVDGYHGLGAIETDLNELADRIFYLAGSYKYLQAGEGCCFISVPRNCQLRPEYTGWFADFSNLAKPQQGRVEYARDGFRFAGATMDFSALYRLEAVLQLWRENGYKIADMHAHVRALQTYFLERLATLEHPHLNAEWLLSDASDDHGHFLTFRLKNAELVAEFAEKLRLHGVHTDYRNDRLRFGFAVYQSKDDFERVWQAIAAVK